LELTITSRRADLTNSMKEYAEEKVSKLDRYYDRIISTDVIIDQESAEQHRVEIVVRADHKQTFVAHVDASTFYEAMDLVIDKIGRQLSTHKDKVRNRKKSNKAG
jgi:putative sigma-54 modulation protein